MTPAPTPSNVLTERVIGCAYRVKTALGHGFVEKVYENALAHELSKTDLHIERQYRMTVHYDGVSVGEFAADFMVNDSLIVEIKAVATLDKAHRAQCLNYLKASGRKLGLLINFGAPEIEIRRIANGL